MDATKLQIILTEHGQWLRDEGGSRADLTDANLTGANLTDADLTGANLAGANLARANLTEADLTDANLTDANLTRADLTRANLAGANLAGADLTGANLTRANLTDADLDFSSWPLWCGSFEVKVDKRLAAQLAYHFCRLDCDDSDVQAAQNAIRDLANTFRRVDECSEIETKGGGQRG